MQWNRWHRFVSNPKFNAFITVLDPLYMSDDETDDSEKEYPLSDYWVVYGGYDIHRSNLKIVALVVCSRGEGAKKELRLYCWKRKGVEWKVELATQDTKKWNWEKIAIKANVLKQEYSIV